MIYIKDSGGIILKLCPPIFVLSGCDLASLRARNSTALIEPLIMRKEIDQHIRQWQDSRGFKFGAGVGALILTYAGAAWAFAALINSAGAASWEFGMSAMPALALTVMSVMRLVAIAKHPWPDASYNASGADAAERARRGRKVGLWFGIVFGVEAIVIASTAMFLARSGRPLLIPVAVVAIVGAHFLPLARIFRIPIYGFAGAFLMAAALGSLLIVDEPTRVFDLGIATAVALWVSAGAVLAVHTRLSSTARADERQYP
jgi:hypothetical protein